jgi:hypothetical protein
MRPARFTSALLAVPLLVVVNANTADAAPPSNDTFAGATPVTFGFSEELDTTEATTDANDDEINSCNTPTDASVWYSFTSPVDAQVAVFVSGSSYDAAVIVGVGSPGNFEGLHCGFGVGFLADAGTTYYIVVVDPQTDGGGNGGTLRITIGGAPTPTVDVTVDPSARFDPGTGTATITGTYTCTGGDSISIFSALRQERGPFAVVGSFFLEDEGVCDGTTRPWSAEIVPESAKYAGGKAVASVSAGVCGPFQCRNDDEERTVMLRRGPQ